MDKGAKAHLRLLCLLIISVLSYPVHVKVTKRGVLREVFSHPPDVVLSQCHVLVTASASAMRYALDLGSLQAPGDAETIVRNRGGCNSAQGNLSSAGTRHSPEAMLPLLGAGNGGRTGLCFLLLLLCPDCLRGLLANTFPR